jgi:hypothetical protein
MQTVCLAKLFSYRYSYYGYELEEGWDELCMREMINFNKILLMNI